MPEFERYEVEGETEGDMRVRHLGERVRLGGGPGFLAKSAANVVPAFRAILFSDVTQSAWTGYTPTITQSGTVTSLSANTFRYKQIDKTVFVEGRATVNNAGTAAGTNDISISLPVTGLASDTPYMGSGAVFDTSASLIYNAVMRLATTTTAKFQTIRTGTAPLSAAGNVFLGSIDFTAALATGDVLDVSLFYEAA